MSPAILLLAFLPSAPAPLARPAPPAAPAREGGIEFRMENKNWREVLVWVGLQAGMPVIGSTVAGSFSYVGPKGVKYHIPQVVSIVNGALLQQGLQLSWRERCFVVVSLD